MDRGAWWAIVHSVANSRRRPKKLSTQLMRVSLVAWMVKNLQCRKSGFSPWVEKIPWRRKWQPDPVFLPGKFHGQKGLVGNSLWGCKELDKSEHTQSQSSQLINNVVIDSGGQQRDSVIHIHVSTLPQIPLPSRLLHYIEQSSLCYTV